MTDTSLDVHVIVFSCDRAMQLDALLRSYRRHVRVPPPVSVLFRTSSRAHAHAYAELVSRHPSAAFVDQGPKRAFRRVLLKTLDEVNAARVLFLVDDNVFIEPVDFAAFDPFPPSDFVPSLRLGAQLSYCYTLARPQPLPPLEPTANGLLTWAWSEGVHDWGYPLSVDGHLFSREEIRAGLERLSFKAPNSLEHALQELRPEFVERRGVCYETSRIVNIPWNRVQNEGKRNRHGDVEHAFLLEQWEDGSELDLASLDHARPISVHQEFPLVLRPRADAETKG